MSELAQQIANRLAQISGVEAVALGGSLARGDAHPDSDTDLGIYYFSDTPPRIAALRELAKDIDDSGSGSAVTIFGEWGPWINGGAWLTVQGQRVDWIYRNIDRVSQTIGECHAGQSSCHYQPGHPHGFYDHVYMGEVFYCKPLYDPRGTLANLKSLTIPYPPKLKKTLIDRLWEASFALDTTRKSVERGDVFHVAGSFFRCAAVMVQALFALNERYWINEKGSVKAIMTFPLHPADFESIVNGVLANPGSSAVELRANFQKLEQLVQATQELCHANPSP